jgi:L-rhamnose mutarotase
MKKLITVFGFFILTNTHGQLTISNTTYSTTQLVTDVLIPTGSGTVVSNVSFRGCLNVSNRYQAGYFSAATSTASQMGFTNGVILSTGNTSDVPLTMGVNPGSVAQISRNYVSGTSGEIRSSNAPAGQDVDVANLISPENYFNGAVLEFDFIPINSFVQFRYVFGSEEYDDVSGSAFAINYNCSQYNDKFAFLLSGPGIAGGQGYSNNATNIARLANNSEVEINSVNNGVVGSSGGSPNASNCTAANPLWTNGASTSQFNGFINGTNLNGNTNVLTAFYSGLTPGQTYHIRIIIADAQDGAYDSVVYLEQSSFNTEVVPLSMELEGFNATCSGDGVLLNWTTTSELYNDNFIISRSEDGISFRELTRVASLGQSTVQQHYSFIDNERKNELFYYRLSQTDANGSMKELKTISVNNNCKEVMDDLQINFLSSSNTINFELLEKKEGVIYIDIISNMGQRVQSSRSSLENESSFQIQINNPLNSGIYFVVVNLNGKLVSKKILIP